MHYKAICDVCGRKFKASQLRLRWDGLFVCSSDWEERHPQDFIRIRSETHILPFTRPEPTDYYHYPKGLWDSYTVSDSFTYVFTVKGFTDTVTYTDTFSYLKGKIFLDFVTYTDTGTMTNPPYFASDFCDATYTASTISFT